MYAYIYIYDVATSSNAYQTRDTYCVRGLFIFITPMFLSGSMSGSVRIRRDFLICTSFLVYLLLIAAYRVKVYVQ